MSVLYSLSLHNPWCKLRHDIDITHRVVISHTTLTYETENKCQSAQQQSRFNRLWFHQNSPVLILEDKFPQFEVTEDQSVVVAMCHSRGYLIEESGSFVLPQLLAGSDKRVHVAIAPLEEHICSRLPKQYLQNLVNMLVLAQGKVGCQ